MITVQKIKRLIQCLCIPLIMYMPVFISAAAQDLLSEVAAQEEALFPFNYENEDLISIINFFAHEKGINIIFPQADPINTKVTLHLDNKVTAEQGWSLIGTLLDTAGFIIVPHHNAVRIMKNVGKDVSREPMPTYIGVSLDQLPGSDQYIRYLYYLANIKVSDAPENELNGILKDLLPDNALYKADSNTNGLLLVAKSNDIKAAMKIVIELDTVGFQEKVDILSLNYTEASVVAQLLNEQLLKVENTNSYRLDTKKAKDVPYFSGFTKIIPEERLNKLILLGRAQAVDRLKSFIKTYIDVAPDTGKSTLHVYRLQYLDAAQFAPVLKSIVEGSQSSGGYSQARGGERKIGGVERFFDEVVIVADKPTSESDDVKYYGNNKLIISARNDDWKRIKKIIEEIDQPQKQVLLEILIGDLTVDDTRALGSMIRIPSKIPFVDGMEFQSAQMGLQPIPNQLPNPTSLDADLLKIAYQPNGKLGTTVGSSANAVNSAASFASAGSTMLSLNDNDGHTWSILQVLQTCSNSKILSHPHVMATNNKEARVKIGEQRFLTDAASGSLGGSTVINLKPIDALLEVKITPRIGSTEMVNLQILVTINEFIDTAASGINTQTTRNLETNANIKSGGIFALGGLIKNTMVNVVSEMPFLSRIPIFGSFFRRRSKEKRQDNLTVFICPTIIEPRLRGGVNEYTDEYITLAKKYAGEELFVNLKDPVTHWFFGSVDDSDARIDRYIERTQESGKNLGAGVNESPVSVRQVVMNPENLLVENDVPDLKEMLKDEQNPFERA